MKTLREMINLIEMAPYVDKEPHGKGSLTQYPIDPDGTMSISAINRNYDIFDEVSIPGLATIALYMLKNKSCIIGVDARSLKNERPTIIFRLDLNPGFKFRFDGFSNTMQIQDIAIDDKYESYGVAKAVYTRLASRGYTVVSDNTQHEPAVGLWKSLAQKPSAKVYIVNIFRGPIIENGVPLRYNGTNIPDDQIWSSGGNYNGLDIVLALLSD